MGTTADKLNRLQQDKEAIKTAIVNKGVAIPSDARFKDFATLLSAATNVMNTELKEKYMEYSPASEASVLKGYKACVNGKTITGNARKITVETIQRKDYPIASGNDLKPGYTELERYTFPAYTGIPEYVLMYQYFISANEYMICLCRLSDQKLIYCYTTLDGRSGSLDFTATEAEIQSNKRYIAFDVITDSSSTVVVLKSVNKSTGTMVYINATLWFF